MMILFIGVSVQTYFISPRARKFLGRARWVWEASCQLCPRLASGCPRPACAGSPLKLFSTHHRPPPSPAGGRRSHSRRTCSVSWGPLRTVASLAAAGTCHSARNGSSSSIPASGGSGGGSGGGGDSTDHLGRYCSLVLETLSLAFHPQRTIAKESLAFGVLLGKTFQERRKIPCQEC